MDGNFKVQTTAKNFYLEISFINYSKQVVEEFDLQGARINLGQSNRSNRGYQSKVRCRIEPNNHSIVILIGDSDCGDEIPNGRIWINKEQYFDNVPVVAWEFSLGGYQPAQKWLKDRKESTLEFDGILYYQKIIVALSETDRLMKEIDKIEIE